LYPLFILTFCPTSALFTQLLQLSESKHQN